MAQQSNSTVTVASPEVLRNVVLVGSAGSGKTTLFDHLLRARVPGYRGSKDDAERSAALTLATIASGDVVINLLDAPGHPDYVGELRAGLRAADACIFVVSAADGIDAVTAALWRECAAVSMPRAIAITKLDSGRATFEQMVDECVATLTPGILPSYLPLLEGDKMIGNMSLVSLRVHDYSTGAVASRDVTDTEREQIETYRAPFIEGIIEESEDADLMDRYLEGNELKRDEVLVDLHKAIARSHFFPVIPVSALDGIGAEELLGLIERGFPTPCQHPLPEATTPNLDPLPGLECSPDAPLVAEVVRTTSDQFAGRQSMVRIFSGTLKADDLVHVSGHRATFAGDDSGSGNHDVVERVGPLFGMDGVEIKPRTQAVAGDIVLITKLSKAETSDTLSSPERPALIEPWALPEPLLPVAIKAATRNDEDKLAGALARLAVEDTTARLEKGTETDQLVLWTMGQAHADLLTTRLTERYGVKIETEPVRIALRETFVTKAEATGRHVKQSGGHGQYAVCHLIIEPNERGAGFEFIDKVVGGAVPRNFIPSVEKGVRNAMEKGVLAGYPMVDIKVTLDDGKFHPVDSSDMAFQMAGALALKEAVSTKTCTLLEPVDEVAITVDNEFQGAVMTDLTTRRGRVIGTEPSDGRVTIRAHVPASELSRYAIDLRGLAHGSGTFTRQFAQYEQLPAALVEKHAKANSD